MRLGDCRQWNREWQYMETWETYLSANGLIWSSLPLEECSAVLRLYSVHAGLVQRASQRVQSSVIGCWRPLAPVK